ncbi:MAG: DUF1828 domain-containing protein [Pirellulales bacterium]|nr:DUF1828 domain-containing protein [Pirellulales bacterium]
MIPISPCEMIGANLSSLFTCSEHGEFRRIRTPFLYPDGDNIDLFCKQQENSFTITDLGETTRWLRMQTVSPRRSPKQKAIIEDVCLTHGVELYKGMLLARVRNQEDFAMVVTRMAQAALRVSDLWFSFRTQAVQSITDEVGDFLLEKNLNFDRGEKLLGRSGRSWTVDFHIRTPQRSSLVYLLATGSRSAARPVVEHVLAAWYDLQSFHVGPEALQFISLFDDTVDVWSSEDFKMIDPLSTISRWSAPDEFLDNLQAV